MSIIKIRKINGFSLLEVMLVIVIMTMIAVFALRMQGPHFRQAMVDRAATQEKQIMEAATSYYIDNGKWPVLEGTTTSPSPDNIQELTNPSSSKGNASYLPPSILDKKTRQLMSPFGDPYSIGPFTATDQTDGTANSNATIFEVQVDTKDPATAILLKSKLPLSYISTGTDSKLTLVTAYINIPSYDYNHANALSDIGIYHPGDCIPAPSYACPRGMEPASFASLEQGYGFSKDPKALDTDDNSAAPIVGLSAYIISGTDPTTGEPILAPRCDLNSQIQTIQFHADSGSGDPSSDGAYGNCNNPGEDRVCVTINTTSNFNSGVVLLDQPRLRNTFIVVMRKCVPKTTE